jgi:hypothetical protein
MADYVLIFCVCVSCTSWALLSVSTAFLVLLSVHLFPHVDFSCLFWDLSTGHVVRPQLKCEKFSF